MRKLRIILPSAMLVLLMAGAPSVLAQSGGDYELTWTSVDSGGMTLTGGDYSLVSTIGQPEPGVVQGGGDYTLTGGVVDAGGSTVAPTDETRLFLPLILNR